MNNKEFEKFIYEQIPITKAMGISIEKFTSSEVKVLAKLEPNINHKSTAFGGSINSVMTVCGWSLVYCRM